MKIKKIITSILLILIIAIQTCSYSNSVEISASSAILINSSSGKILYEKNAYEKKYPASTTKILTAILVIESLNLADQITASESAIQAVPSGYVTAYIKAGETFTVDELLQILLVKSANEVGYIFAEKISGSNEKFAELMNSKALEIGCKNSHFTNPSGLHDENHYTTAYDLALIAQYCMKNETFRKYVKMPSCTIKPTNKSGERIYQNTNEMLNSKSEYYNSKIIGIKTGTTTSAGNCIISAYVNDYMEMISVVLDAPNTTSNNKNARFVDTLSLFNYGEQNYSIKKIKEQNSIIKNIEISNATFKTKKLDILLKNDINALVNNSLDISLLVPEITLNNNIQAPINEGDILGKITYTIDDITYTEDLIAANAVEKSYLLDIIIKVAIALFVLFVLFTLISKKKKSKKKRKTKKYKR